MSNSAIGQKSDSAQSDITQNASMIALLKGLLEQMQGSGATPTAVDVTDDATRDLGKVDVAGIDAVGDVAGQAVMTSSLPVVIASDQSPTSVKVDQTTPGSTNGVYVNTIAASGSTDIGAITDSAVTDPTASASIIALLKGTLKQFQGSGTGSQNINIFHNSKSSTNTTLLNAVIATTTSAEKNCVTYNAVALECTVSDIISGSWDVEILGCNISGGVFGSIFDENSRQMIVQNLNTNATTTFIFKGIPNYIKVVGTRTTDGTLTCIATCLNL